MIFLLGRWARGCAPASSLLAQVRLSDGRLAWPVARAAGLSEPTFRRVSRRVFRLTRLSQGRSPSAGRLALRNARDGLRNGLLICLRSARPVRRPCPRSWPERQVSTADGYSGVIWQDGDYRLIVSPRGTTYAVQVLGPGGSWLIDREFSSAAFLGHWLACVAIDPSPALLQAAAGLPDDPASSGFPYRRSAS